MAYEQKDNSFSLFDNRDKKRTDTDADFGGTLKLNGVEYWINGWKKDSGKLVMSGSVKPKKYSGAPENKPAPSPAPDDYEDSVPW